MMEGVGGLVSLVRFFRGVRFVSVDMSRTSPSGMWRQYSLLCWETAIDGSLFPEWKHSISSSL